MRESTLEDYFIAQCAANGWEYRKVAWVGRRSAPDRLIMVLGGIYVELKAPGKKLRPDQLREQGLMRAGDMQVRMIDTKAQVDDLVKSINGILLLRK
tara:strand:- start:4262 stop:4552 length:291 start_codon:yes stop_codon:yes gene_type:complete